MEALDLSSVNVRQLKFLAPWAYLRDLESLNLSSNYVQSLQWLPELNSLKALNVRDNGLGYLDGITAFPELTELDLRENLFVSRTSVVEELERRGFLECEERMTFALQLVCDADSN